MQDHGRNLLGGILLARLRDPDAGIGAGSFHDLVGQHLFGLFHLGVVVASPHQTLDGEDGVIGVDHCLALGRLAHRALTRLGEGHHRRAQAPAFSGSDHRWIATFHHSDGGIGCSQVNTYNFRHLTIPPLTFVLYLLAFPIGRRRVGRNDTCTATSGERHNGSVIIGTGQPGVIALTGAAPAASQTAIGYAVNDGRSPAYFDAAIGTDWFPAHVASPSGYCALILPCYC